MAFRKLNDEQLSRVLSECAGPGLSRGGNREMLAGRCCLVQAATIGPDASDPGGELRRHAEWFDSLGGFRFLRYGGNERYSRGPEALLRAMEKAGIA